MFGGEGSVQPHFQHADFFAAVNQIAHGFIGGFHTGTHQHDDPFCIGRADIIEQVVFPPDDTGKFVHRFLNDVRGYQIVRVDRFPRLEEDIGVLCRAANGGAVG